MKPVVTASIIGTVLQLAMVIAGHSNPAIAAQFAVGGMSISLIAGVLYAALERPAIKKDAAVNGSITGGVCAIIGIGVSFALGDVTAIILAVGTLSSAVTGAIGGLVGQLAFARNTRNAASA